MWKDTNHGLYWAKIGDKDMSYNGFCSYCGATLPEIGYCDKWCKISMWVWKIIFRVTRWWKSPLSCKLGFHKTSKTNIGYDLRKQSVDFFCTKCDKRVVTKKLDDAGNVPEVMKLLKWAKKGGTA